MKSFLNYSGKGGVGKSTITYCLYQAFKEIGKDVMVLDMDLNTPSMSVLMGDGKDLVSSKDNPILFSDASIINLFVKNAVNTIRRRNPEILLIDTPPSITTIHQTIIKKLKISGCILISQPTELSKNDVERTVPFFTQKGISVVGIIENMASKKETLSYTYPKLLSVQRISVLDSTKVWIKHQRVFEELAEKLLLLDLGEVEQENRKKVLFDETIDWPTVKRLYHLIEERDGEVNIESTRLRRHALKFKDVKFINISTWEKLHSFFVGRNSYDPVGLGNTKDCVTEATYEKVKRLIDVFKTSDKCMFMIVNNPNTVIPTITGEYGVCTLKIDDKFHGIPTVEFQTSKGVVRMFPHEVMPVTEKMMIQATEDGYKYNKTGDRFIPSLDTCLEISNCFGGRVGMPEKSEGVIELHKTVEQS